MLKTLSNNFAPPQHDCQCHAAESTMVYIAAPYSHPDPVENTHVVCRIADALLAAGYVPVLPHLTLLWHLVSPKPYDTWIAYDRELLKRCDLVLRVPGHSPGATDECLLATALNIPVIQPRSADPTDCVAALTHFFSN